MFKRKSAAPAVSPLTPPPASNQFPPQQRGMHPNGNGQMSGPGGSQPGGGNRHSMLSPPVRGDSGYSGGSATDRVRSQTDTVKSDKADKRRSGIFGFGKKDKDKDKKDEAAAPRASFSVDRPQGGQDQYPHRMQQHPAPTSGQPLPSARMTGSQTMRNMASAPPQTAAQDFGPGYGGMPRSQTMGGQSQLQPQPQRQGSGGVPETHPYRGFLTAQQDRQQQQQGSGLPRSVSSPVGQPLAPPPPTKAAPTPPAGPAGGPTGRSAAPGSADWMSEFDPIVDLIQAQPAKTYVASPPELEMILARTSVGGQPKQGQPGSASNDWDAVWLQLSGISLSMWSMKETRAAAARGEKVPPTYFNITDSSLELLAPLPPPPHRPQSHPHHHVFSLNTAGSNRLLFSSPSETDMARWTTGLRLAAWERARLEEIYTGHLIKSGGREPKNELARGRMEGWVRVRIMGGTEWKRLWMVLSTPEGDQEDVKRERRRSFFGMVEKEKETVQEPNTGVAMASFYAEQRTVKNKHIAPVLSIWNVSQAYAVFPERLEVMSQSNLMKVVGKIGGEMVTIEGRLRDSGWALIMPESDPQTTGSATPPQASPLSDMMRWVTGVHDVFKLYGRPERYAWDPQDPKSLFFAYPRGEARNRLFLDIDEAMLSDFRTSHLATIRAQFIGILQKKLSGEDDRYAMESESNGRGAPAPADGNYRLPPLTFDDPRASDPSQSQPRSLTPITERTDIASRANSSRTGKSSVFGFQGERKPSVGSSSRDGSGGAEKKASGSSVRAEDSRLATIADSSEQVGVLTEQPAHVSDETAQPHHQGQEGLRPTAPGEPLVIDTDRRSFVTDSVYSQPSANTPTRRQSPAPLSTIPSANEVPTVASNAGSSGAYGRLPPTAMQELDDRSVVRQASGGEVKALPPLAAPIASPASPGSPSVLSSGTHSHVHSPVPRKASADGSQIGAGLTEEPAAMYLMNMVDGQAPAGRAAVLQGQTSAQPVRQGTGPGNQAAQAPGYAEATGTANSAALTSPDVSSPASSTSVSAARMSQPRTEMGRKPSGARALPVKKVSSPSPQLPPVPIEQPELLDVASPAAQAQRQRTSSGDLAPTNELSEDASTFLAYADQASPEKPAKALAPITTTAEPRADKQAIRSSFIPSQAAADRRARAEQQSAEQQRAMHVPGGGRRVSTAQDTWSGSEESEDEDEPPASAQPASATRALPPLPPAPSAQFSQLRTSSPPAPAPPQAEQPRLARHAQPSPSQTGQAAMNPGNRHSVWNANFSHEHGMQPSASGKFLDLEDRDAQLTRAFAPHGLLQAGLQDKEDRSAKRQEELAREMGSSLVNVPAAPPPPSAGLLGAVAQHEKTRQNPGGLGATLTEKENQKRVAEDRQREIERLQRQQVEYARSHGSEAGYGGSQFGGYGMMRNMGMMGMPQNPYGYNPYSHQQAMMAAQMAYQQAMMAYGGGGQGSNSHLQPGGLSPGDHRAGSPAGSLHSASPSHGPASHAGHSPSPSPGFPFGGFGGFPQMNMGGMGYGSWPGMGMPMNMGWGGSPGWQGMPGGQASPAMYTGGSLPYGMGSAGPSTPHEQDGAAAHYSNGTGAGGGAHAS